MDYDVQDSLFEACKLYDEREDEGLEDCEGHPIACLDELLDTVALKAVGRPMQAQNHSSKPTDIKCSLSTSSAPVTLHASFLGETEAAVKRKRRRNVANNAEKQPGPRSNVGHAPFEDRAANASERTMRRKEAAKQAKKQRRKRKRDERREEGLFNPEVVVRLSWSERHGTPQVIRTSLGADELNAAKGAWVGVRKPVKPNVTAVDDGLRDGLRVLKWDGMYVLVQFYSLLPYSPLC